MKMGGNNSFDVSRNIRFVTRYVKCDCCDLSFKYQTFAEATESRTRCEGCETHRLDGTEAEQLEALRQHEPRLRKWNRDVTAKADEMQTEVNERRATDIERRRQVKAALESRDKWRAVAIAVLDEHDGPVGPRRLCTCGKAFPCPTVLAAQTTDYGSWRYLDRSRPERQLNEYAKQRWLDDIDADRLDGSAG